MLCIPKKLSATSAFHLTQFKKVTDPLSLRPHILDRLKPFGKTTALLVNLYTSLVKTMRTLLVPSSYAWNIMLEGHGGPGIGSYQARVAGIPFQEFKKFLTFLKTEITTHILLYSTCYAGSKWLLKAYTTRGNPDKYPFPIILTGVSDAPTYFYYSRTKAGVISGKELYIRFFNSIKTLPLCKKNIQKLGLAAAILLQAVRYDHTQKRYRLTTSNNILQIRWPEATDFEPINLTNIIQTASHNNDQPSSDPTDVLIIDTPVTSRTLHLQHPNQKIVSKLPLEWHLISAITIGNKKPLTEQLKELLDAFSSVRSLSAPKNFLIDRLYNAQGALQATKLLIAPQSTSQLFEELPKAIKKRIKKTSKLFYQIGTKIYHLQSDSTTPTELKPLQARRYLRQYEREHTKLVTQHDKQGSYL